MESKDIKFGFFGTPDVAAETLQYLADFGYMPKVVVTSPDAPAGRGMQIKESPIAEFARINGVPCLKPESLSDLEIEPEVDIFVVVAYGKIIPEKVLDMPRLGSYNIHYSLLPKYRGASPVESAILNGDTETGVSIQKMVYKMDAGPIVEMEKVKIGPDETAPALRSRLTEIGANLLARKLPDIVAGKINPVEQNEAEATFCKKIEKEDGLIDLNDDPVKNYNKFRAYAAWPRTYFFKDGKRIIITAAELKDGKFLIKKVIPEGKKEQGYKN